MTTTLDRQLSGEQTFANSGASLTLLRLDANSLLTQRGRCVVADVPGAPDRLWYVMRFTIDAQGQLTVTPVMPYPGVLHRRALRPELVIVRYRSAAGSR